MTARFTTARREILALALLLAAVAVPFNMATPGRQRKPDVPACSEDRPKDIDGQPDRVLESKYAAGPPPHGRIVGLDQTRQDSPPFSGAILPEPPEQRTPWNPPETTLAKPLLSATAALFEAGLADPRGGEYRVI